MVFESLEEKDAQIYNAPKAREKNFWGYTTPFGYQKHAPSEKSEKKRFDPKFFWKKIYGPSLFCKKNFFENEKNGKKIKKIWEKN